jgi:hypothetical protein
MAPPRRQTKPLKASNTQIIDFTATDEDTIECELPAIKLPLVVRLNLTHLATSPRLT